MEQEVRIWLLLPSSLHVRCGLMRLAPRCNVVVDARRVLAFVYDWLDAVSVCLRVVLWRDVWRSEDESGTDSALAL